MHYIELKSRKGQVSETMTWIVATIAILFLTIAFIFMSDLLGKTRISFSFTDKSKSNLEIQESIFAILGKVSAEGKVIDFINNGNYVKARSEIDSALQQFASKGVKCDFFLYNLDSQGNPNDYLFKSIRYAEAGYGTADRIIKLKLNGQKEGSLEC